MKNGALAIVIIIIVGMAGAECSAAQPQQPNGALFVFGDSLYDTGNKAFSSKDALSNYLPYGETYFNKAAGRYTDGRVIPDWIAQMAGIPFPPAYLQPNLTDYTKGVNFAYAGAPVLVGSRPDTMNMKMQVDSWLEVIGRLKSEMGGEETERLLEKAVFLLSVGVDYIDFCKNHTSSPYTQAALSHLTAMVIGNITSHIQTIYKQGGRRFAFQNVGPLGCSPGMRQAYVSAGHAARACIPEAQYVATYHNLGFLAAVRDLRLLLPGLRYSIFDYFTQGTNRVLFHNIYGFKDPTNACCGTGMYNGRSNSCAMQTAAYNVCSNPNEYVWFDAAHPTERANGQYARLFWSGPPDVVGALTMRELFTLNLYHQASR